MPDTANGHDGCAEGSAISQMLIDTLKAGRGLPSLEALLSESPLTAEQRELVGLLSTLDWGEDGKVDEHTVIAGEAAGYGVDDGCVLSKPADADEFRRVLDELADLRVVNDTAAAALGACRVCWGGDDVCPHCAGRGHAGARPPDSELFEMLVAPAVVRMRAVAGTAGGTARPRGAY